MGLEERVQALAATDRLLIALDFDGTLAPLVDDPLASRALPAAIAAITELGALPDTRVAIVTGRDLATLERIFPESRDLLRIGSHGAEFDLDGHSSPPVTEAQSALVTALAQRFESFVADVPGAFVELKPAGLSVHTRRAEPEAAAALTQNIREWVRTDTRGLHERSGKNVLEYALQGTDKGTAIDQLREYWAPTGILYAGDDVTDEDAFHRLGAGDLSIHIGDLSTDAQVSVADPEAFAEVLRNLVTKRAERAAG